MQTAKPQPPRGDIENTRDTLDIVPVCKAVGDPLRANILRALGQDSFAVLELCDLFSMAQPAMSHHLKALHEAGLVSKRREGTSIFYQRLFYQSQGLSRLAYVSALFAELDSQPLDPRYRKNMARIYAQRVQRSQAFFKSNADALVQQTELICAPEVYAEAVMQGALLQAANRRGHALEVGPGDGIILAGLSACFDQVTGVDIAAQMLSKAQARVAPLANVTLREEDFLHLTESARFDLVVASMVLHHSASPLQFVEQAAALLRPGGLLVIAELCAHDQDWVKDACGDVWLGFTPDQLQAWAQESGYESLQQQFLAQRNGFRVQVHTFQLNEPTH